MNRIRISIMILALFLGFSGCMENSNPETWSDEKINEWFNNSKWTGRWKVKPDSSVNKKALAVSYYKNKERWDKAFSFLKNTDLESLEVKRYDIDGDNLYASVSEYVTKDENEAMFEAHRKYIDIQYVIRGTETIQVAPLAMRDSVSQEYDENRDIEFFSVRESKSLLATPDKFFIFFPSDAHKPGIIAGKPDSVKKIVVKLRID
ncbi:MAG: YhcH/YjgK/YiaL family protein [Bacteroidales bacterium]|nr:YhcH/YjgK/YiaL family protein [Bacteroidales bacterium]